MNRRARKVLSAFPATRPTSLWPRPHVPREPIFALHSRGRHRFFYGTTGPRPRMRSGAAALLSQGGICLEGPEPLRSWARLLYPFVVGTRYPRSCTRIMPSLPWICERILWARAITVALAGRWPTPLLDAVVEA